MILPSLADVEAAAVRLAGRIERTPLVELAASALRGGPRLLLKLENRQRTRSFKPRGALNAALKAASLGPLSGLVTFSSGNHGQAVALAAQELGVPCTVVAPEDARAVKVAAMEARGARVVRCGLTSPERMARALEIVAETGWLLVPPYDHPDVVAGQGTIGLELLEDAAIDICCTPIGGGGLSSGLCVALAGRVPVFGVEPSDADDARRSLESGSLASNASPSRSSCDGLRNTRVGDLNFAILRERLAGVVTVTEREIETACRAIEDAGFGPVEPSGAAATAAVLAGRVGVHGQIVIAIVSGGNV